MDIVSILQMTNVAMAAHKDFDHCEYSSAAEPPVQCGESHLSRLTGATNSLFC